MIFIGIDWSRSKHDVAIIAPEGKTLHRIAVKHDGVALADLARQIARLESDPTQVRVAIELHDGAVLTWLLDQGYIVYGMNPKSAERARDRYRPSGAKDDKADAYILADLLRLDAKYLRPLKPKSEGTQKLNYWVRLRADLVQSKTRACQQLRGLLDEHCPALTALCKDLDLIWVRDLLKQFPLDEDLCAAHGNSINAFAKTHRLRAATKDRMREARARTPLPISAARREMLRFHIGMLVERIEDLLKRVAEIEAILEPLVSNHPDAAVFRSLPVQATATTAGLLAVFDEDKRDAPSWQQIAAHCGAAPVTAASGRSRRVTRRRACDHTLNQVLIQFAFQTAFIEGCWAAEYYQAKRSAGVAHYTTLRCLAQRWIKIIYHLWKHGVPYDEQVHQTNRRRHDPTAQSQLNQDSN